MISVNLHYSTILIFCVVYICGLVMAVYSTFQARTPQGTVAWILGLVFFPFLGIPLFLIFGKKHLDGYNDYEKEVSGIRLKYQRDLETFIFNHHCKSPIENFFTNTKNSFMSGNKIKLLKNGDQTFTEMLEAINQARHSICLQIFIFRTDEIGKTFAEALARKAREGVKTYILYQNFIIYVSQEVIVQMKEAGVHIGEFPHIKRSQLRLNFQNHKKQLIIDGKIGFFGGINIGDDYLGNYPQIGFWRDTNVRVEGPAVVEAQVDFYKDWIWSQDDRPEITWPSLAAAGHSSIALMSSGPADDKHINLLQHIEMINSTRSRLWIANPYIVPPQGLMDAIIIARFRGVDVRLLVPSKEKCDNKFVARAADVYLERLTQNGVRIYKYNKGMMHQKVILIDDNLALIGSSNFDFRSMYIDFENGIVTNDTLFIKEVEDAFHEDFENSTEVNYEEYRNLPFKMKLTSHFANCLTPIL